jgi:peroxiredoxin
MSCRTELGELAKRIRLPLLSGTVIVGISVDEDAEAARRYAAELALPWRNLLAPGGFESPVMRNYGIPALPYSILVDSDGRVREKQTAIRIVMNSD